MTLFTTTTILPENAEFVSIHILMITDNDNDDHHNHFHRISILSRVIY
jgi:hypothetical protein